MTATEAYKHFQLKVNKNDTNSDVDISKGEFVLLYNEMKDRWLKEKINDNQSSDRVQDLQELQIKHFEIPLVASEKEYDVFALPDNFFNFIDSYSYCSFGQCGEIILRHYAFKSKNENMLLENTNTAPSLDFEETVVDLSENKLFVYKDDSFRITRTLVNYYRPPTEIDLEGYIKLDGSKSTNIDPDISDVYIQEILNRCAKEVIRRYENPEGFQLAAERLNTEN